MSPRDDPGVGSDETDGDEEEEEEEESGDAAFDLGVCEFTECRGCGPCLLVPRGGESDRRTPSPPTLWHISIPKTGSTTFNAILNSPAVPLRSCVFYWRLLKVLDAVLSRSGAGHCAPGPLPRDVNDVLHRVGTRKVRTAGCEALSAEWDLGMVRALQDATRTVRPNLGTFTMLREPVARAISQVNHMRDKGYLNRWNATEALRNLLSPDGCVHDAAFCANISDPSMCSARGSCGLFRNLQALHLAGWSAHVRPLPNLVRISTDDSYLLSEAVANLESLEAFGLLEHMRESVCLMAHTFEWTETFERCCRGEGEAARHPGLCGPIERTRKNVRSYARPDAAFRRAAADANRVDVALYAHAEEVFWHRVDAVERSTGAEFSRPRPGGGEEKKAGPMEKVVDRRDSRRLIREDGWTSNGNDPNEVYERGLAAYAVGESELKKAAKSFSSAKMVHGQSLRTTILTDLHGLEWVQHSSHVMGHPFDRAVNILGETARVENMKRYYELLSEKVDGSEEDHKSIRTNGVKNVMNCLTGQAVKEGKIMAFRAAARLHRHFVFTDADVKHCDSRAVEDLFLILRERSHLGLILVSNADNKCTAIYGTECDMWMREHYPGIHEEANSGVVAVNGKSPFVNRVLTEWQVQYRALMGTPCGAKGQDQKPLRVAIHKAQAEMGLDYANSSAPVLYLWDDPNHVTHGYEPSDNPYNCRTPGGSTQGGQRRDQRGVCQHPVYRHCSIIHGHTRAAANVDSKTLRETMVRPGTAVPWDVIAFPHIPRTGGHAFKTSLLKVLAKATGGNKKAINIDDGVELFRQPEASRSWDPPRILHGAFSGDACRWLREIDARSPGAGGAASAAPPRTCGYVTILRDPVDRLVSELNYCEEVGWTAEQACTGPRGARELQDAVAAAHVRGGPGEALATFAERRGNVMLEHVAAPLVAADFFQAGQPDDWHGRDIAARVNPMEMRRQRQGRVNGADLAMGRLILSAQYAVVGLLDRLEETYERILRAVAPELVGRVNVTSLIEAGLRDSHNHTEFRNAKAPKLCSRSDLSAEQLERVMYAVELDIELYAYARHLFNVAGSATRWEEELGSLEKQEKAAYGMEYLEAQKMPEGMSWENSPKRQCSGASRRKSPSDIRQGEVQN